MKIILFSLEFKIMIVLSNYSLFNIAIAMMDFSLLLLVDLLLSFYLEKKKNCKDIDLKGKIK